MASSKDIFEANIWEANIFAAGIFRGFGVKPVTSTNRNRSYFYAAGPDRQSGKDRGPDNRTFRAAGADGLYNGAIGG